MKLTVLLENAPRPGFKAEHGLSLLAQTSGKTILFDFGQSDAFARNADALGIDLNNVDLAVLSHGHYDHGDGIGEFFRRNDHAPVYASRDAFQDFRHGAKYIGLDPQLQTHPRMTLLEKDLEILPGVSLRCCAGRERFCPPEQDGLTVGALNDDFRHEICLEIIEKGTRFLLSGCSHNGIKNLLSWFSPDVFIGGLHTRSMAPDSPEFRTLISALDRSGCRFYTGHCTGRAQFEALRERLGLRAEYLFTGLDFFL